ncbi:TPA: DnaB-like helicase N-terminal domain-containing protein [Clostridium botulinum]|uniref:DnaB-like helicase N-terminal domain-containing protein n=2 Tax=Clostridium botulinum TaxID=1491 RepID=UPI0004646FA9|nr:DnaB-like helicase N-terminal domain-containing protein [Clostridium botulinum]APR02539.1 hypothetical protein RSJ2_3972 [Clostridium botulinum]AUN01493.1 hypothetical protein RSJ19_00480 [Clostridium botulinum]MBN3359222.1 hypothetical protein [Clostridium botulinum]QDY27070.1 hypothetical protein CGQ40_20410 [Clostridium botulinum]
MNNKKLIKLYYDSRTGFQVIGCLLKKPILLRDKKYDLSPDDFYNNFHQYVFSAINNLYENGVEEINFVEIEAYLHQSSPKGYKIVFEDNEGMEWLTNCEENSALSNFEYNYNRLKKFSILRDALTEGEDVSDILDLEEIDNKQIEIQSKAFDSLTIKELIQHFDKRILKLKTKYNNNKSEDYLKAGDCSEEILERIKKGETYGLLSFSGFKNRITYGNRRKKFHLCSGGSGVGKSRTALCEIACCVATELWDFNKKQFVKNPNNPDGDLSAIYIGTEMDLKMEVSIILWGIISGIETSKIIEKELDEEEWKRLYYAIDVLKRSKIHLYNEPNYDIAYIDNLITSHTLKGEDVYAIGIDYILLTGNLVLEAREYSKGMYTREDQLFLYVSKMFKEEISNKHNVFVSSSTQLNRNKSLPDSERDESMIRGSFSLCDKIDIGSIILEPTKKELEKVEDIIKQTQKWNLKRPNQVEHIFKNRGGKWKKIRIFRYVNLGNMDSTDLFVTDWDFKLIEDIEQILPIIAYEEKHIKSFED